MNTITIKFRAKRDDFADGEGYKVPRLTHSHVTVAERDTVATIFLQNLNNEDVTRARLERLAGLTLPGVVYAAAPGDWTVTPVGRGFLAEVSVTRPFSRQAVTSS